MMLFTALNLLYIYYLIKENESTPSCCIYWLSFELFLLVWDQLGVNIVTLFNKKPLHSFSIAFKNFLNK